MSTTKATASNLWCPFDKHGNRLCIADRCAAWRWAEDQRWPRFRACDENLEATVEPDRPAYIPHDWIWCPHGDECAGWSEPDEQASAHRLGYCGLAGKPLGVA